jgi:hypothetical protein
MANRSAIAVSVFSPPESRSIDVGRFPLGFAMISIFASSGSTPSSILRSHSSPSRKSSLKILIKFSRIFPNVSEKMRCAVS